MFCKLVFVLLFSGLLLLAAACSDDSGAKSDIESNKVGGTNSGNSLGEKEAVGLPEKTQNIRLVDAESGLKMRHEPSLEATVRQIIPFGEKVNLLEEQTEEITIGGRNGVWSRISWDGNYGWVFGGFLLEVDEYMEKKRKNTRLVDAESGLKMRAQSSMEGDVQCVIPFEDSVLVLEEQEDEMTIGGKTGVWSLVQWNEKTGWVFGGFLTESITDTITVDGIDIEVELYKGTREELLEMFTPEESYRYNFMLILAGQYESVSLAEDKKQKGKYGYAILRDLYGVFDYECGELIFKTNNSFTCFPESDEPFTEYMSNFEIQRYIKTKTSFKVWTKKNDRDLIIFSSGHLKLFNKNIKKLEVGSYKGMNFLQAIEKLNNDGVPYYFIVSDSSEDQKNGGVVFGQQINYYGMYKENLLLFITEPDYIPKGKVFGLFKTEISDFIMDKKVEVIAVSGGERTTLMSMPHPGGKLSIPYILDENAEIIVLVDGEQRIKEKVEAY